MKKKWQVPGFILKKMVFSQNKLFKTVLLVSSVLITTASAQTPATAEVPAKAKEIEKIEVIGTRIKRVQSEGPSAVKTIKKEAMESSGNLSVSDVLRDSNVATFGVSRESSGSNAAATTNIGLRGLGATRTLILLNGHRLPKDPSTEAVDLNLIPESAIERVEILKDGASALYGSDALGGVINIVTKKGFVGNEFSMQLSSPQRVGNQSMNFSLLSGSTTEKSDFLSVLSFSRSEKLFGKDREITKNGLSAIGAVASYKNASGTWAVDPSVSCPSELLKDVPGGKKCYFKYNEIATTRPLIATINYLTDYTYRIDSNLKFYNRNFFVLKDIEWNYAPAPAAFSTPSGTSTIPSARTVSYRFMEAGNRDNKDTEKNYSTLVGLKGFISSWEWDLSAGYSKVFRENLGISGYLDQNVLDGLITSGGFDPFKPAGSRGDLSTAIVQPFQQSESSIFTTDLVFSGDLFEMENGSAAGAFGLSIWNEKLDQRTDSKSLSGVVIGSAGSTDKGSRDVRSLFSEVSIPTAKDLEIQLAARFDNYSDFGSTVNPKLAAKYQINNKLLLRGSVGTGFKAPTLSQLYSARSEGYPEFIDRKGCASNSLLCSSDQYLVVSGGNKDLKEEKAITTGVGLVADPFADLSTSADLWYSKITNVVGMDLEEMTKAELNGVDPAKYGVTVERDSNNAITKVNAPNLNLQEEEISGLDLNADYHITNDFFGHQLILQEDYSYMLFYKKEGFPGAGKRNVIGEWGAPRWRNTASLTMKELKWSYSLLLRSIPGQNVVDNEKKEKINDLNEFDLSVTYKHSKTALFSAGIKNVLDSNQPTDINGGTGGAAVINSDLYDINGRKFFVGYAQKF